MALLTGEELADGLQIEYSGDIVDVLDQVAAAATDLVARQITAAAVTAEPASCKEAAMSVGSEIFQARTAAGGEAVSIDFTPAPRMSVWLIRRIEALIAPYKKVEGMVG